MGMDVERLPAMIRREPFSMCLRENARSAADALTSCRPTRNLLFLGTRRFSRGTKSGTACAIALVRLLGEENPPCCAWRSGEHSLCFSRLHPGLYNEPKCVNDEFISLN